MLRHTSILVAGSLSLTLAAIASAQITTGSIAGTVRDSTGALLAGVTVDV